MRLTVLAAFAAAACLPTDPALALNLPGTKYYQKMVIQDCGPSVAGDCKLTFPAVPADKALFVSAVGCTLTVQPAEGQVWRIYAASNLDPIFPLTIEKTAASGSSTGFSASQEGDFFITPGQEPTIWIRTSKSTSQSVICTIAGRLLAP